MTGKRFAIVLLAALVAIAGAMYLSSLRHLERDERGQPLVAGLASRLDSITEVRLRKASAQPTATLQRTAPGEWKVAQREGYPADATKVRKLLIALGDARIIEPKTADPANYAKLGVEDPGSASSTGTEVSLVAPGSTTAVIIGRSTGSGNYARQVGTASSAAIEPGIEAPAEPREWIDARLLDIPVEKIQSVHAELADGTSYTIARKPSAAPATLNTPTNRAAGQNAAGGPAEFVLESAPPGRQPNEASLLAPSASTFSGVTAEDVADASTVDFSKGSLLRIGMQDKGSDVLRGVVVGERHWLQIAATSDAALAKRTAGRAYDLAGYRYDALFRPLEQLLKPKPTQPDAKSPGKPSTRQLPSRADAASTQIKNSSPAPSSPAAAAP